jgi:CheY-like chemotaxis protein/anti-sigma regulatory factor (Ser/Thr protein kinase)
VPEVWVGDPGRLLQICNNLVGNAIKFTHDGHVTVEFMSSASGGLELTVQDTGLGMSPEVLSRVFDAFEQADSSTVRHFGGTGLGLSIVRGLVAQMSGTVKLESTPKVGTCATVRLPLKPSKNGMVERDGRRHAVALPRGLRILVVDDVETNILVLGAHLRGFGADVTTASGGREAILKASDSDFDLLLLDISMPDLDGTQVLNLIRNQEIQRGQKPTPAIAVSAHALPHQIAEYLALGFAAHVPKPFTRAQLYTGLAEVVATEQFSGRTVLSIPAAEQILARRSMG